jgi:hypothetical protein
MPLSAIMRGRAGGRPEVWRGSSEHLATELDNDTVHGQLMPGDTSCPAEHQGASQRYNFNAL